MIREPTERTCSKYGFTLAEWRLLLDEQGGVCGVCGKIPSSGIFVFDHVHVRGWAMMPDEERKKWVRGILCNSCNHHILSRYMTPEKAEGAARYLRAFEARLAVDRGA